MRTLHVDGTRAWPFPWRKLSEAKRATMRAFAVHPRHHYAYAGSAIRITVAGDSARDCEMRVTAICQDYRLPIQRTLETLRRVRTGDAKRH